jgi:hypothetical protein
LRHLKRVRHDDLKNSWLNDSRQPISKEKNRDNNRRDGDADHAEQENLPAAIFTGLGRPPRHPGHEAKADVGQPTNRTSFAFRLLFSAIGANKHGKSMMLLNSKNPVAPG